MYALLTAAVLTASVLAAPQYPPDPYTPPPDPYYAPPAPQTYTVKVGEDEWGANKNIYNPLYLSGVAVGSTIVFEFRNKNHTVTQSTFDVPCSKLDGGFTTGFVPATPEIPTRTYTVDREGPLWFYCGQGNHCEEDGMVFAINPGAEYSGFTFADFQKKALDTPPDSPVAPPSGGDNWSTPIYPTAVPVTATVTDADGSYWTTTWNSYPGSGDPTPLPEPAIHTVVVGGLDDEGRPKLAYDPPYVEAAVYDIVRFEFRQKNHTVTQSSFNNPCRKLEFISDEKGFDSGFMFVDNGVTEYPTWDVVVNDTRPIWAYCRQGNHCGSGMVFAVNPNQESEFNFENFQTLAMRINGTSGTGSATNPTATASVGKGFIASPSALHAAMGFVVVGLSAVIAF